MVTDEGFMTKMLNLSVEKICHERMHLAKTGSLMIVELLVCTLLESFQLHLG
jgi:hypothetical protein